MDQQNQERGPSLNLPTPQMERPYAANEQHPSEYTAPTEKSMGQAIERGTPSPLQPPAVGTQPPQQTAPSSQQPPQPPQQTAPSVADDSSMPQIADDIDLIEKEWVAKAKEIVAMTKNDPYAQSKEMNKVKADYLKKRYNKDLKTAED